MRRKLLLAGAMLLLAMGGPAQAQQTTRVSTPTGQRLQAGVGDVILHAETREPLPNVFGARDIFGCTRPAGAVTVQYGGTQAARQCCCAARSRYNRTPRR